MAFTYMGGEGNVECSMEFKLLDLLFPTQIHTKAMGHSVNYHTASYSSSSVFGWRWSRRCRRWSRSRWRWSRPRWLRRLHIPAARDIGVIDAEPGQIVDLVVLVRVEVTGAHGGASRASAGGQVRVSPANVP